MFQTYSSNTGSLGHVSTFEILQGLLFIDASSTGSPILAT